MGVNSDQPGKPFQPLPVTPGVPPSGIATGGQTNIRQMANDAKQRITNKQRRFMQLLSTTEQAGADKYVKAGQLLADDRITKLIDKLLFNK